MIVDRITITYSYPAAPGEAVGEPSSVTVSGKGSDGVTMTSQSTSFQYDGRGHRTAEIDASGNETDYAYDVAGNPSTVTYPANNTGTPLARAQSVTHYQYLGGPVDYEALYGEANPPGSGTALRATSYTYGHEGELLKAIDLVGLLGTWSYDGLYRQQTIGDGNGNLTTYVYDAVGNLSNVYYPGYVMSLFPDSLSFQYDFDGNMTQRVDGNGATTTYTLDSAVDSRLIKTVHPAQPGIDVTYGYDDFGRVTSLMNGNATKTSVLDELGNLLTSTTSFTGGPQSQSLNYAYNPDGSRRYVQLPGTGQVSTPLTVNSGQLSYAYDGLGRLIGVTLPWIQGSASLGSGTESLSYGYQANGWLTSATNSLFRRAYSYLPRGFLKSLSNTYVGNVMGHNSLLSSYTMAPGDYDAAGNRLNELADIDNVQNSSQTNQTHALSHTRALMYDARDQLRGEQVTPAKAPSGDQGEDIPVNHYTQYFDYDLAGNPTNFRGASAGLSGNGFNVDNQITNTGFGYDGNGNGTKNFTNIYGYDIENRLNSITGFNYTATTGPDDLRASKTTGQGTVYYLTDEDDQPLAEETYSASTASLSLIYARGADGLGEIYYPGTLQYYTFAFDPEGNVMCRDNSANSGSIGTEASDVAVMDSYGELLLDQRPSDGRTTTHRDSVGFGGQWGAYTDWDVILGTNTIAGMLTGQNVLNIYPVFMAHRTYDNRTGRFVNRDPIGYSGGINLYGYAGNNPVMGVDPDGFWERKSAYAGPNYDPSPNPSIANRLSHPDATHTDPAKWAPNYPPGNAKREFGDLYPATQRLMVTMHLSGRIIQGIGNDWSSFGFHYASGPGYTDAVDLLVSDLSQSQIRALVHRLRMAGLAAWGRIHGGDNLNTHIHFDDPAIPGINPLNYEQIQDFLKSGSGSQKRHRRDPTITLEERQAVVSRYNMYHGANDQLPYPTK